MNKPRLKEVNEKEIMDIGPLREKDRQFVTALARGLDVLRSFRPGENMLGNQEISRRTGLPKPTVSRLTYTLTRLGYLRHSKELSKYSLGTGVLSLGYTLLASHDIRRIARPHMQELADQVQASVSLGARDRLNMVYVENCRASSTVTLRMDVGSTIPIATTAMGRAFLAALPEWERDYLMESIKKRSAENWPKIKEGIERAFKEYEERGFVSAVGEWQKDVSAVGVPMSTPDGHIIAFNCGGPTFSLKRGQLEDDVGPRLVNMVREIQSQLQQTT
ncbi:MAG TPA: IclR family transcriptional regulator [Burkholderiales bacterium]|jgi:DNA-binding IclR family transcriptional regulator|nr:IclR family transcriptional regulator [Burkholderiales bacterium]